MIEIRAIPRRERLVVVFRGKVLEEEVERLEEEFQEALKLVAPGFDLISDISGAEALTPGAEVRIRRIAELFLPAGLRTCVRVVGRSGPAALQFQRISWAVGYDSRLAYSLAEAERLLDGPG